MKAKQILLFFIGLTFLISCHGNNSTNRSDSENPNQVSAPQSKEDIDQIIFGVYCGECSGHCATMYCYNLEGNQNSFSIDSTDSFFWRKYNNGKIMFYTYRNDKFHFDIGTEIIANIPDTLLNSDKSSQSFGCPDCTDGCGIYFELTRNGETKRFFIDYQTSQLTGEIKVFAEFLKDKLMILDGVRH